MKKLVITAAFVLTALVASATTTHNTYTREIVTRTTETEFKWEVKNTYDTDVRVMRLMFYNTYTRTLIGSVDVNKNLGAGEKVSGTITLPKGTPESAVYVWEVVLPEFNVQGEEE